jgi:hypothetical protein
MMHILFSREPWFAAKRLGYGAGLPIRWQGWAVYAAFIGAASGLALGVREGDLPRPAAVAIGLAALCLLLAITARHTEGGWRWRWGSRR